MPDTKRHEDWFNKAQAEFASALILMEHGGDNAVIAFLCQQAIEKALKGFVLQKKMELIEGHSLIYLCKKSTELDASFKGFMKDCAYVNQFYLETRYPADIPLSVDDSEVKECINIAQSLLDRIICDSIK